MILVLHPGKMHPSTIKADPFLKQVIILLNYVFYFRLKNFSLCFSNDLLTIFFYYFTGFYVVQPPVFTVRA